MKKILFTVALTLLAMSLQGQNYVIIKGGLAIPNGKYGDINDLNSWALLSSSTKYGGAGLGFGLGMSFKYDFSSARGFGVIFSANAIYNSLSSDVNDFVDDIESSGFDVSKPAYFNFPITGGLNYMYKLNDEIKFFLEGQLGINIRIITTYERSKVGYEDEYEYETATSMAYQVGAGFLFKNTYSISLEYFDLGAATVKSNETIRQGSTTSHYKRNQGKVDPTMIMLRLGYNF